MQDFIQTDTCSPYSNGIRAYNKMCYQESRWHAICNHTIHARVECPKKCARYGSIDSVETQLTAYCHACRRHVDSLGVAARYQNQNTHRLSRRRSKRTSAGLPMDAAGKALAGSMSFDSLRLAATSPAPTSRLPDPPQRKLSSSASGDSLHWSFSDGGGSRKASMVTIMSDFVQEYEKQQQQQQQAAEGETLKDIRPVMLSPVPQKVSQVHYRIPSCRRVKVIPPDAENNKTQPLLSLRIPEEEDAPQASDLKSPASDDLSSSQHTAPDEGDPRNNNASPATRSPATSPRTPSSISASLEEPPSKPPATPLPRLPPLDFSSSSSSGGLGFGPEKLIDLRKGLRKTQSFSRLMGRALTPKPQVVEITSPRKSNFAATTAAAAGAGAGAAGAVGAATATVGAAPVVVPPPPPKVRPSSPLPELTSRDLRKTKSSRTLADRFDQQNNTGPKSLNTGPVFGDRKVTTTPPPSMRTRAPVGTNYFPPPAPKQKLIDIHDPEWLAKHGLKWDAHGLGIVSAAV